MTREDEAISKMTPGELYKWDCAETLKELNRRYNVIESVDELKGWHIFESTPYKPGVIRVMLTRPSGNGYRMIHGFVSTHILTTARELGYIAKSNGRSLP